MSQPDSTSLPVALAPWVECRQERCRGGRMLITAVNHRDGTAMHLDPTDVDPHFGARYEATMRALRDGGFVATPGAANAAADRDGLRRRSAGAGLVWRGADRVVRRWHRAGLRRAFDRSWFAAQIGVAALGAVAFVLTLRTTGFQLHAHPGQIPAILVLGLAAVAIHELGHAVVTVHYGRRVRMAGVRLHLGTPAFYVESVDALLLTRRQRLIQAAAGPWAEWLATSVVAIAFVALPRDIADAAILHRFVIVNTFTIVTNLLPFVGLDGALLLADAVREPDLPFRAQNVLLTPAGTGRDRWLTAYASANTMVALALLVAAGFFWWQLFGALGMQLWALGPGGVVVVLVAGLALGHQVLSMMAATLAAVRPQASRLWSRVVFRAERRWRVRAISAFRGLPPFADLDESDLGIVAGHLQRLCHANCVDPSPSGYVYVDRAGRRRAEGRVDLTAGAVIPFEPTVVDALEFGAVLVWLPEAWRKLLPR